MGNKQTDQIYLEKINLYRDSIVSSLQSIEDILREHFPNQLDMAYQHWMPQILTALYSDTKWLSRGTYSMDDTIKNIKDIIAEESFKGVNKFIK